MDESPKRNRDKYNPYYLSSDKNKGIFIVKIVNKDIGEDVSVNISKELFDLMDELEKDEARIIQSDKRNLEKSELMEMTLYTRAMEKPKSLEDKVIEKIEKEKLRKALNSLSDMQRRRILLHFKYNLSFSQIAEIEGCSKIAVKYSIDNALEELRKKFLEKN